MTTLLVYFSPMLRMHSRSLYQVQRLVAQARLKVGNSYCEIANSYLHGFSKAPQEVIIWVLRWNSVKPRKMKT